MFKALLSKFTLHASHVLIGAILANITGLAGLVAGHIPATVVSALATVGITLNPAILATAIAAGITNAIAHYATGGK